MTSGTRRRGLLDADGGLTTDGRLERDAVESLTDAAASGPFVRLGTERAERLITLLGPLRAAILGGGGIPVPNPMGLPGPSGPLSGKPSDRATLT